MEQEAVSYRERDYDLNGSVYRVRDVLQDGKFVRCEVALREEDKDVWHPCQEGSLFEDLPIYRVGPYAGGSDA